MCSIKKFDLTKYGSPKYFIHSLMPLWSTRLCFAHMQLCGIKIHRQVTSWTRHLILLWNLALMRISLEKRTLHTTSFFLVNETTPARWRQQYLYDIPASARLAGDIRKTKRTTQMPSCCHSSQARWKWAPTHHTSPFCKVHATTIT